MSHTTKGCFSGFLFFCFIGNNYLKSSPNSKSKKNSVLTIQTFTDNFVKKVDEKVTIKEKEIMTI